MVNPAVFTLMGVLALFATLAVLFKYRKNENEVERQAVLLFLELSGQLVGLGIFAFYAFDLQTAMGNLRLLALAFFVLFSALVFLPKVSRAAIFVLLAAVSIYAFYYAVSNGEFLVGKFFGAEQGGLLFYASVVLWLFSLVSMLWGGGKDISGLLAKRQ